MVISKEEGKTQGLYLGLNPFQPPPNLLIFFKSAPQNNMYQNLFAYLINLLGIPFSSRLSTGSRCFVASLNITGNSFKEHETANK